MLWQFHISYGVKEEVGFSKTGHKEHAVPKTLLWLLWSLAHFHSCLLTVCKHSPSTLQCEKCNTICQQRLFTFLVKASTSEMCWLQLLGTTFIEKVSLSKLWNTSFTLLLASVCRQVEVFHANYRQLWQSADIQSNNDGVFGASSSLQLISPADSNIQQPIREQTFVSSKQWFPGVAN